MRLSRTSVLRGFAAQQKRALTAKPRKAAFYLLAEQVLNETHAKWPLMND